MKFRTEKDTVCRIWCARTAGAAKGVLPAAGGMGSSILLDPLDVFRLSEGLHKNFDELLAEHIELNIVDGLILPNLKMAGEKEQCTFLNAEGRCSVHALRPGICRLFPLGRIYENRSFQYFLQVYECKKESRAKVKVQKWLGMPDAKRYERSVSEWHYFLKDLQQQMEAEQNADTMKAVSMYVLKSFYLTPYDSGRDFYEQFEERLEKGRYTLDIVFYKA